ncbi:MAG: PD40 domain-containing protein [Planctomycetes bacterium]|nr:PD40 domain-containing protein [Planctomycetota bacterium]
MKRLLGACLALIAVSAYVPQTVAQPTARAPQLELPPVAQRILRQPALSPDGKTLAFVYDGDIWSVPATGGEARRLTITVDNDGDPVFSPDGQWIAFRSRRYGNDDVFIMPAAGGPATRLTFSDAGEIPCCWLPDSSGVIFMAALRDGGRDLWVVRTDASEPWPITGGGFGTHESWATISPSGKQIAYVDRASDPMRTRGYNGTANGDIWLCDFDGLTTSNHRQLTNNRSHDSWPVFADNDTIVYSTCAAGPKTSSRVARLTAVSTRGETPRGWGGEANLDPREISINGGKIAFATGNYGGWRLHVGNLGTRPPVSLSTPDIRISSDVRTAEVKSTRLGTASEYQVSPDGKKIAFVAGGDLFVMPTEEGGVPRQLTNTPDREKDVQWKSDSRTLVFTRRNQIEFFDVAENGPLLLGRVSPFTSATRPVYLPGDKLLCVINEAAIQEWTEVPSVRVPGYFHGANLGSGKAFDISPDGKWILYSQPNEIYDWQLWVAHTETGERRQLARLFGGCTSFSFTRDGKRVVFANDEVDDNHDIWVIDLQKPPVEFKEDKLDRLFKKDEKPGNAEKASEAGEENDQPKPAQPKAPAAKKPPETKIDFDDIRLRTRRVTSLEGNEFSPVCLDDGRTFFFIGSVQGQSNLWKLTLDPEKGPDLKQVTQSRTRKSDLRLSPDEKSLWYLDAGVISSMNIASSRVITYSFSIEQRRNRNELRDAAFEEAAWVMGSYFYDAGHHGVDWAATSDRYRSALNATSTGAEFGSVVNELLGELSSSHQGFGAQDDRSDGFTESTGCLGLRFDPAGLSRSEYLVTEVLKGGPLDVAEAPAAGIKLVGINGMALGQGRTLAQELSGTIGRKTILHFNDKFILEGARQVAVKPISRGAENRLFYERWVAWQRDMVGRLSGGRLGYVHIRGMDTPSLQEFIHQLGDDLVGKEGVVIDVRFNGGGSTAVDVLEILIKQPWLIRQNRGLHKVSENAYRSITLEKPSILMINQDSFSNAEILAEGFRKLKIGTIVGVDTAGGVIGTGGYTLIDGSSLRLPGTGAYTVEGENLEQNGRKPDIFIDNNINDLEKGIDRQTELTVKTLLGQLKK